MRRHSRLRDALIASLVGLTIACAVNIGGIVMLQAGSRESLPTLTEATRTGAETVGLTVAGQLGRALGYGIPLDGLYDLKGYFGAIVSGSPNIEALALHDLSGGVVFESRPNVEGTAFHIEVDGVEKATLVLSATPPLLGPAIDRLRLALTVNSVLFGLIGGAVVFLLLTRHYATSRRRLGALMLDAVEDRFPPLPPLRGSGTVAGAYRAYNQCLEVLRGAARTLDDAVATVRAIDFDGSLSHKLEPIIKPVSGALSLSAIDDAAEPAWREQRSGAIWLAIIVAGTFAMAFPFVANFAIDREWAHASPAWWPVVPVLVEVAVGSLVFALIRGIADVARPVAAASGLIIAGFASAAAFWVRDYTIFLEVRAIAAAGLGITIAALAGRQFSRDRAPFLTTLLFAAMVAGPVIGALLGEAVGRRMGFVTIGCLLVALAPVALIVRGSDRSDFAKSKNPLHFWRQLPLAAAGVAIGSTFLVWLPAGPGYENYLIGGLMIAAAGFAAIALPVHSVLIAGGLAVIGMIVVSNPNIPLAFAGMLLLGGGLGGLVASGRSGLDRAIAPFGLGLFAGASSVGLASMIDLPALAPAAILVAVLALAGAATATRAARTAGQG